MVGPGPTWSRRSGGIPVRVGVVAVGAGQDLRATLAELEALGVASIDVDRVRQVGRGARDRAPDLDQLCGRCADGKLAVSPNGEVWPCVFARRLRLEFCSSARSTRCPPNDGNPCGGPLCLPHLRHPPRGPGADR
jgi:hypothetical protein